MTHPTTEAGRAPVNEMAEIVISVACQQGSLDLFIRNYDAILDSALLIADPPSVAIADEFQGYGGRNIPVVTPDGTVGIVPALP
jgi:hypothetical protein